MIVIPKREAVRHSNKFIVYLPLDCNEIWEKLKKLKRKARIYRDSRNSHQPKLHLKVPNHDVSIRNLTGNQTKK